MRQPTLRPSITSPTAAISTRAGGGEGVGGGVGLGVGARVGAALAVAVAVGGAGVVVGDEGSGLRRGGGFVRGDAAGPEEGRSKHRREQEGERPRAAAVFRRQAAPRASC